MARIFLSNKYVILGALLVALISPPAFPSTENILSDAYSNTYFQPYHTNSFMFKHTHDDNASTEIRISIRYWFVSKPGEPRSIFGIKDTSAFFSYTGKYDFYWLPIHDTRLSGPVVSRYQNPALHLRYTGFPIIDYFDIGLEHISNGQTLDAATNKQIVLSAYQTGNHTIMDSISRVGATAALTLEINKEFKHNLTKDLRPALTLKGYAIRSDQEAEVYWGSRANDNVDYSNYQLVNFSWRYPIKRISKLSNMPMVFTGDINIGSSGIPAASYNLMFSFPIGVFPLAVSAHFGPLNNLSDYTKWQNTYAIGMAIAY